MSDKKHLGMGVMLQMLGGNEDSVNALRSVIGKTIDSIELRTHNDEDSIFITTKEGEQIRLYDGGQSCCESRYARTDDDLSYHVGATIVNFETRAAAEVAKGEDDYGEHEIEFLLIITSKGVITVANHNEHNGYYGGFYVKAEKMN